MDSNTMDGLLPALPDHRDSDGNDETARLSQATDELLPDDLYPQHVVTIQAERFRVFEGLLRNHLKFVKYSTMQQSLARVRDLGVKVSRHGRDRPLGIIRKLAAQLKEHGEAIAAIMIKAALNVAENAIDDEETAIMDEFLQLAVDSFLDHRRKGCQFIYTVLEGLVQRDADGDGSLDSPDQLDLSNEGSESPYLDLTVFVGNEMVPVHFREILAFFWAPHSQLTTDCHACALPFVGEPPIRTINILMGDGRIGGVRVFNRHFSCMKESRIPFVPVSHVWTDSIRQANANRAHNDAAATKLISTLVGLGMGAERAYGSDVEFWHDYFSVPQWHPEVKEQLLIRLPAIYHLSEEILVHLDDVSPSSLPILLAGLSKRLAGNDPLLRATKALPYIRGVLEAQWMSRMWVLLEYAQCRAACVMTKGGHIHRLRDQDMQKETLEKFYARNSFSQLLNYVRGYQYDLLRYAGTIATSIGDMTQFLGELGPRHLLAGNHPLTLGQAMEFVAGKQCQYSRDRIIALDVLLDGQRTAWQPVSEAILPVPEAEACAHVWLKALRQGDCTPLLLQPRESILGSNPSNHPGLASWVVGHSGLEGAEWAYGIQQTPPDLVPVITDEGVIRLTLALVGEIEEICYMGVEMSGNLARVDFSLNLIDEVARAECMKMSPELLVDSMNRIFPFGLIFQQDARRKGHLFSFADLAGRDPEFSERARRLLTKYNDAGDWPTIEEVAQSISDTLELEANIFKDEGLTATRLSHSQLIARRREERGAKGGDPICKVRCPECRQVALFRVDLRETGGVGQQVYHIPGLTYLNSTEDGVGLVIDKEGRITGRMFFGPPACDCRLMVDVDIH